ncbi:golgin subfamily A member 4-like isoform X2 [Ornithodoros turicata]|uniref:golgin subfamily A member 4-like isoform X2 n=1 Tax=Ornithodoros turicata TaxID=34597 RepID=UPI003139ECE2
MFKRLKERIEEVKQTPLRFPQFPAQAESGDDSTAANDLMHFGETNGPAIQPEPSSTQATHTTPDQFSITDDDDASSSSNTPQKDRSTQDSAFEEISISEDLERPRTPRARNSDAAILPVYHSPDRPQYVPQSDIESEVEDPQHGINLESVSKEQLFAAFQKTRARVQKYKTKYTEVVKAYKELDGEKDKIKRILTDSQDKALRRIEELREQSHLEQKAKAHLEDNLRCLLEEKEEMIKVLHTKVSLLKSGTGRDVESSETNEEPSRSPPAGDEDIGAYKEKVKRLEILLAKCKDTIKSGRERTTQLVEEKESLTKALEQKVNELQQVQEKEAEVQAVLRGKLQDLREETALARAQQEEAMAETKRNIHHELELKERQLTEAQEQLQEAHAATEALKAQLEENKATLEKKEKEHEEARHGLEQQLTSLERTLEEERKISLQELSRGKAAALNLMKQECEKKIQAAEHNWVQRLEASEKEYHRRISEKENELHKVAKKLSELKSITEESEDLAADDREQQNSTPNYEVQRDSLLKDIELYKNVKEKLEQTVKELKEELQQKNVCFHAEKEDLLQKHKTEVEQLRQEHLNALKESQSELEKVSMLQEELKYVKEKHAEEVEEMKKNWEHACDSNITSLREQHALELHSLEKKWSEKLAFETSELEAKLEELAQAHSALVESSASLQSQLDEKDRLQSEELRRLKSDYDASRLLAEHKLSEDYKNELAHLKCELEKEHMAQVNELKKATDAALQEKTLLKEKLSELASAHEESLKEKLNEIATLQQHNKDLVTGHSTLEGELSSYKTNMQTLQEQCQKLTKEREDVRKDESQRLTELHAERDSLQTELRQLQSQLKESQSSVQDLENQIQSVKSVHDQEKEYLEQKLQHALSDERHKFEEEIQQLRSVLESTTTSLQTEREKIAELNAQLSSLRLEGETVSEERASARLRCTELEDQLSAQLQALQSAEEQVTALSSQYNSLQEETQFLHDEQRRLSDHIKFLEGCQDALKAELQQEREEKSSLQGSLQNDSEELRRIQNESDSIKTCLEDEIKQLKGEISSLEHKLDDLTSSNTLLQCQHKELTVVSKAERENLKEIHSQLEVTQAERDALNSRVEYLTENEQGMNQRNAALEKEVQVLIATVEDLKMSLVRLEDERNGLTAELDATKGQLQTLRVAHEDQLQSSLKERETFQKALGDLESQYNIAVEEQKAVEQEVKALRSKDEDANHYLEEHDKLACRVDELEEENKALRCAHEERMKLFEDQLAEKSKEILCYTEKLAQSELSHAAEVEELHKGAKEKEEQYRSQIDTLQQDLKTRTEQLDESLIVAEERAALAAVQLQEAVHNVTAQSDAELASTNKELSQKISSLEAELSRQMAEAKGKIQELEDTLAEKDSAIHSQFKEVARSFSSQLEAQEAEHDQSLSNAIDKAQQIEAKLAIEHRREMEALEQELAEKVNALEEVHEHYQELLKQKDEELKTLRSETGRPSEPAEDGGWDDEWPKIDEEEWSGPSSDHSPAHQNQAKGNKNYDKSTVYLQQIETLKLAIGKYQDEIGDLRCILGSRQNNNGSPASKNCVRLPEPTEYEYLRNILFEYMMGKETVTLCKVIAAVLKFTDEQTNQILQREAAKQQVQMKS